jgi:hypothetical protein
LSHAYLSAPLSLARSLFTFSPPLRCFYFPPPHPDLPKHLNFYRLYPSVPGSYVPPVAIGSFATELEEPEMAEGFAEEVKRIGWVGWWDGVGGDATVGGGGNGMDEKKKRRWEGWMI